MELLKIHSKNENDFRKTQSYLGQNTISYTTLSPNDQRPQKIVISDIPPFTDPKLIIDVLKEHSFIANKAAVIKSRRTGSYMPIYVLNAISKANFEDIFKIHEICYIRVIECFKSTNTVNQCYKCQHFGNASEIRRFKAKCIKCTGLLITFSCPKVGKITSKCANCSGEHPPTYRGCPKPSQSRKKNIPKQQFLKKESPKIFPFMMTKILSSHNYFKNLLLILSRVIKFRNRTLFLL